eukprot:TRINITY_DN39580_c0_g1_i1.p1 TRINITY_DN39580_c0_g1~~TRINITY_DN39580_c0_g1_i1.p1  ORF type:complete len:699 (-),score=219.62 TRINITY_DN39580_c0_g1_i1:238-2334(-)
MAGSGQVLGWPPTRRPIGWSQAAKSPVSYSASQPAGEKRVLPENPFAAADQAAEKDKLAEDLRQAAEEWKQLLLDHTADVREGPPDCYLDCFAQQVISAVESFYLAYYERQEVPVLERRAANQRGYLQEMRVYMDKQAKGDLGLGLGALWPRPGQGEEELYIYEPFLFLEARRVQVMRSILNARLRTMLLNKNDLLMKQALAAAARKKEMEAEQEQQRVTRQTSAGSLEDEIRRLQDELHQLRKERKAKEVEAEKAAIAAAAKAAAIHEMLKNQPGARPPAKVEVEDTTALEEENRRLNKMLHDLRMRLQDLEKQKQELLKLKAAAQAEITALKDEIKSLDKQIQAVPKPRTGSKSAAAEETPAEEVVLAEEPKAAKTPKPKKPSTPDAEAEAKAAARKKAAAAKAAAAGEKEAEEREKALKRREKEIAAERKQLLSRIKDLENSIEKLKNRKRSAVDSEQEAESKASSEEEATDAKVKHGHESKGKWPKASGPVEIQRAAKTQFRCRSIFQRLHADGERAEVKRNIMREVYGKMQEDDEDGLGHLAGHATPRLERESRPGRPSVGDGKANKRTSRPSSSGAATQAEKAKAAWLQHWSDAVQAVDVTTKTNRAVALPFGFGATGSPSSRSLLHSRIRSPASRSTPVLSRRSSLPVAARGFARSASQTRITDAARRQLPPPADAGRPKMLVPPVGWAPK